MRFPISNTADRLNLAALSFARRLEVGCSARMADDTAADGGKEKQPA